ncbi:MAG TPA: TetR/AcrR family transcriptional regulator [Actinocrinis sp.]|nr:TetR/AcrR family transcriptional regulator [Actinocrinis sp.]
MARTVGSNAPETRRRILDSAADAFAAHGYSGASMRDIAEGLGITKAALYYHFASKEDLLDGLVHPVMQAMADFVETAQTGDLTVEQILSGFIDLTVDSVPALFPLMVDPGARTAIKARYDFQGLTGRIEAALAAGGSPECRLRAQFVLGGIRSIIVTRLLGGMHGGGKCAGGGQGQATVASQNAGVDTDASYVAGPSSEPTLTKDECAVLLEAALSGLISPQTSSLF